MNVLRHQRNDDTQLPAATRAGCDYARLITDHLAYIENQCRRAVLRTLPPGEGDDDCSNGFDGALQDNQTDELFNEVLDRLQADDFKALREFKGEAKLTTYITTIISNLVIDLVRQKKGRSRARERAREMGEVAEKLYDLVFTRGCTLHQAHCHLEVTHSIRESFERLQEMLSRMRGRERSFAAVAVDGGSTWLVPGRKVFLEEQVELVVADPRKNAEGALIAHQKQERAGRALSELFEDLDGEDRLMLRMRFPADEEPPGSTKEIAALLGVSEKCVDARIRRILLRCREALLKRGVTLRDLID